MITLVMISKFDRKLNEGEIYASEVVPGDRIGVSSNNNFSVGEQFIVLPEQQGVVRLATKVGRSGTIAYLYPDTKVKVYPSIIETSTLK